MVSLTHYIRFSDVSGVKRKTSRIKWVKKIKAVEYATRICVIPEKNSSSMGT